MVTLVHVHDILTGNIMMTHDDDGTHSIKSICTHTAHAETTGIETDH